MLARVWSSRNSHSLLVGMQHGPATLENSLAVSNKTKHNFIVWFSNRAPWYLPKWVENYIHTKTCTQMFIAALFAFAKTWKQPNTKNPIKNGQRRNVYFNLLPIVWLGYLVFLILSCMSCLYILQMNPLSVSSFANIFSHSEGCLFILFMVSFAVQKLLGFIRSH